MDVSLCDICRRVTWVCVGACAGQECATSGVALCPVRSPVSIRAPRRGFRFVVNAGFVSRGFVSFVCSRAIAYAPSLSLVFVTRP